MLPNGEKLRTATKRRYVLVRPDSNGAYVVKRSDNYTILKHVKRTSDFIMDTVLNAPMS